MNRLININDFLDAGRNQVGGKAYSLAKIQQQGILIPHTFCVPCQVFNDFLTQTRLREKILFEINRKPFEKMRWEEIWDTALHIRSFFLTTALPKAVEKELKQSIESHFSNRPVAVRSSAPGEDGASGSFAGLHESFLNITGSREILKHIKLVWASLYSDAALMYRKELNFDIQSSQMAVVIQELIPSSRSGILFTQNPSDQNESVLESVYGLNQGLVDGDIEPDRWILSRKTGKLISHTAPVRVNYARPSASGVMFEKLPVQSVENPPLNSGEVHHVWTTGKKLEALFGRPQDVEWTCFNDQLIILQSRPVTTAGFKETDSKRSWYLTLHRSYENLKKLYKKIEHQLIPEMILTGEELKEQDLGALSVNSLILEIEQRQKIYNHWTKVYWDDFIPFAHGIRLFGQVYNDAVTPDDPYEFMALLENTGLKSMERNQMLENLAQIIREDTKLKERLENDLLPAPDHTFKILLDEFIDRFGDLSCATGAGSECLHGEVALTHLLLEFAGRPPASPKSAQEDAAALKISYLNSFSSDKRQFAEDILVLGRESYRLRDDDNIHLGRIEAGLFEAVKEGRNRVDDPQTPEDVRNRLLNIPAIGLTPESHAPPKLTETMQTDRDRWITSRQIVGHPAGPGIATGPARLIQSPQDLLSFKQGDILVCQGVDPNMTFVVPLAAAVIEERGGMLIHGAIIAREYGLPCITGASNAMQLIDNGTEITVDGYLGIITCRTEDL